MLSLIPSSLMVFKSAVELHRPQTCELENNRSRLMKCSIISPDSSQLSFSTYRSVIWEGPFLDVHANGSLCNEIPSN